MARKIVITTLLLLPWLLWAAYLVNFDKRRVSAAYSSEERFSIKCDIARHVNKADDAGGLPLGLGASGTLRKFFCCATCDDPSVGVGDDNDIFIVFV